MTLALVPFAAMLSAAMTLRDRTIRNVLAFGSVVVTGALASGCLPASPEGPGSNSAIDATSDMLAGGDAAAEAPNPPTFDGSFADFVSPPSPCNGWSQLCDRTYDRVSFPATHASMATSNPPWDFPAQTKSILQQLDDSIRTLMLEVHDVNGVLTLCLQSCDEGSLPLAGQLAQVQQFLATNPREVVTLIIDNRVDASRVASALDDAELSGFLHPQATDAGWPTLGSLITEGQRLVVFVEDATGAPSTLLPLWSFAWATGPDFHTSGDLTCASALGDAKNPLMLVLHFLTTADGVADAGEGGTPVLDSGALTSDGGEPIWTDAPLSGHASAALAATVNSDPFLFDRIQACQVQDSQLPSFVAVDFYDSSDVVTATQILNGLVPVSFAGQDGSTK